jgi:adenylyltransferase/sulfurtransferase
MPLTAEQTERYRRHLLLPEIGGQGQQALLSASILVVGAGALGSAALPYLAAAGVGRIGVCDGDRVELSNLQRQAIFRTEDVGRPKAEVASERLGGLNPDVRWTVHGTFLDEDNADALLAPYDLALEGLDRYAPRFVLNAACLRARKPFVSSAIGRFGGQVALFRLGVGDQPCYACLVPEAPDDEATCEAEGVLGATAGVVGALAASLAIRTICGVGEPEGRLTIYDGLAGTMRTVRLPRDPACLCAAGRRSDRAEAPAGRTWPAGSN